MTGEQLYAVHRKCLMENGIYSKTGAGAYGDISPPHHWYKLDEKLRMAWEATARQLTEQQREHLGAVRRAMDRDPNVYGTPREGEGMLTPVGSEAYGGGPAGY